MSVSSVIHLNEKRKDERRGRGQEALFSFLFRPCAMSSVFLVDFGFLYTSTWSFSETVRRAESKTRSSFRHERRRRESLWEAQLSIDHV